MTDSERDINTPDGPPGDLATSTPPEGAPAVPPAPGPDAHDAGSDGADPHPDEADAYAHHAFGADAAPEPERAPRSPLRIRRPRKPAPVGTPEPDFGEDGYAPVIPLDRASLLAPEPARMRVRIRKLRVFGVLIGLGLLAVVSTVFGMMMAITSDLPELEVQAGRNSVLVDRNGEPLLERPGGQGIDGVPREVSGPAAGNFSHPAQC